MESENRPLWQMSAGPFWASIWENERTIAGKAVKVREVSFAKRFRTESGEYKTSSRYQLNEIPKAMLVLSKAYEQLAMPEREE